MSTVNPTTCFIPAFKKNCRFQDDLVRKLVGVQLIQRTIEIARSFGLPALDVHLLTDSEEIELIGIRAGIRVYRNSGLEWSADALKGELGKYISAVEHNQSFSILLSPYAPFLKGKALSEAVDKFLDSRTHVLQAVRSEKCSLYAGSQQEAESVIVGDRAQPQLVRSNTFMFIRAGLLTKAFGRNLRVMPFPIGDDAIEIRSLRDWWVCEKLMQRRRIVFRVIGNDQVGMGHIYRALSLAHDMTDHEVLFVTD